MSQAIHLVQAKPEMSTPKTLCWRQLPLSCEHAQLLCENANEVFAQLFLQSCHAFWLDGGALKTQASWSYMGQTNAALDKTAFANQAPTLRYPATPSAQYKGEEEQDFFSTLARSVSAPLSYHPPQSPPFAFHGGYIGYIGYEVRAQDQKRAAYAHQSTGLPDALWHYVDKFIAIDHQNHTLFAAAILEDNLATHSCENPSWIDEQLTALHTIIETLTSKKSAAPQKEARASQALAADKDISIDEDASRLAMDVRMQQSDELYLAHIRQAQEWIAQGQSYQVCLTNEFYTEVQVRPFDLYCHLRRLNPAPYAAYLHWQSDEGSLYPDYALLSASPEQFLHYDAVSRRVQTKPIKGTIKRGNTPELDAAQITKLRLSTKDRAENVMIVDLLRNDLSRVCEAASVQVDALFAIESYATVHQMVSTISATLRADCDIGDLLSACFPGGSMTGAPKAHTVELLEQLEQRPRGIYSGAMGWIGLSGSLHLAIVIRSIIAQKLSDNQGSPQYELRLGVGGGIVADSVPESELAEMKLKAQATLKAIAACLASPYPT